MNVSLFFNIGFTCVLVAFTLKIAEPKIILSTAFEDIRDRVKIPTDFLLMTENVGSESRCALACSKHKTCLSFNICSENVCELNKEDIHSTAQLEEILELNDSCLYFGMQRQSVPLCVNNGNHMDIQNNTNTGDCELSSKRVDREWGAWGEAVTVIETADEFKQVSSRQILVEAAHGGVVGDGTAEKITSWLKFVKEKMTFPKARDNCVELGGKLFSDLDGTKDQLAFLLEKTGNQRHWLGIHTDDWNVWKTLDGEVVPAHLLIWKPGKPNNHGGSQFWLANSQGAEGLDDLDIGYSEASVCDIS